MKTLLPEYAPLPPPGLRQVVFSRTGTGISLIPHVLMQCDLDIPSMRRDGSLIHPPVEGTILAKRIGRNDAKSLLRVDHKRSCRFPLVPWNIPAWKTSNNPEAAMREDAKHMEKPCIGALFGSSDL